MASPGEIEPRPLRFPPQRPRTPILTLTPVPIPAPRSAGWLDPRSLRAQSVALFLLFVAFSVSSLVIATNVSNASDATQRQQVALITWRFETVRTGQAAEELGTHLTQLNNSLLKGAPGGAAASLTRAQADLRFIEAQIASIAKLELSSDTAPARAT